MKSKVYIETSIIGYLTSRPTRDLITVANQQLTREWWEEEREKYDLFVSTLVIDEISGGDKTAAMERRNVLGDCKVLLATEEAVVLGQEIIEKYFLPAKSLVDAIHIALSAIYEMDYLLTWNCKHIANATTRGRVTEFLRDKGYKNIIICTPQELQGE